MISAELATRVAEAYDAKSHPEWPDWAELSDIERRRILAVAEAVSNHERANHKAALQALMACVEDAIKECE